MSFRALHATVSVELAPDLVLREVAEAMMAPYPRTDAAALHYRLHHDHLTRGDTRIAADRALDVVPLFERDLYTQVLATAAAGWVLHAAALEIDGRALVLCGASGAGKTTMTLTLAGRGMPILTDEIVWIGRDGTVSGLPRPLTIPFASSQLARIPPRWGRIPYPMRDQDDVVREAVLAVPEPTALQHGSLPLHSIIRMGHGPDWDVFLRSSPPVVALQRLWNRSLRLDDEGLEVATAVLRDHGSFELSSTTEAEALALLDEHLKS